MRSSFRHVLGMLMVGVVGVMGYRVPISDTDSLREVCSGMYGGQKAYIEVSFDPTSSGQVALVIYEWSDVPYLGVDTPDNSVGGVNRPKTYICTTSAARSGLCTSQQLGAFITSVPSGSSINDTSIFTTALKFSSSSFPTGNPIDDMENDEDDEIGPTTTTSQTSTNTRGTMSQATGGGGGGGITGSIDAPEEGDFEPSTGYDGTGDYDFGDDLLDNPNDALSGEEEDDVAAGGTWRGKKRQWDDLLDGVTGGVSDGSDGSKKRPDSTASQSDLDEAEDVVPVYIAPISYSVSKTGYYCVGIVPVTLVNSKRSIDTRQATHAEYSGMVLFRNTFDGELPAVEYPKIYFYMIMSLVYFVLGVGWAVLCFQHFRELLPMQHYISGTIVFLVIEMLAQFAYYRYINKHGGGAGSLAFLFVIAILNAARNSLSFFLLLIVSMGLSVVTESLGSVMNKVRALTAFHFIFGVLYSVGTVEVELDSASTIIVLILIFPLSLTLTAFLMWIIVSLNGTILHLQQRKQKFKLQMFQRLWRILVLAVIGVAGFFVVSSMSLSNRLDEDYAPRNWRYRWISLDGSLATIYLCVFAAIAWIWRPTRNNIRFATSQELAQDEGEADAEDYEIDALENGRRSGRQPLGQEDDYEDDHDDPSKPFSDRPGGGRHGVGEENVVFAMGDDSDEEDDEGDHDGRGSPKGGRRGGGGGGDSPPKYRDSEDGVGATEGGGSSADRRVNKKDTGKDD